MLESKCTAVQHQSTPPSALLAEIKESFAHLSNLHAVLISDFPSLSDQLSQIENIIKTTEQIESSLKRKYPEVTKAKTTLQETYDLFAEKAPLNASYHQKLSEEIEKAKLAYSKYRRIVNGLLPNQGSTSENNASVFKKGKDASNKNDVTSTNKSKCIIS